VEDRVSVVESSLIGQIGDTNAVSPNLPTNENSR
jgi:hypothetical protein